jgi:multidrug efflux pump
MEQLRAAIGNTNVNTAKGSIDGAGQAWIIDSNDQLIDAQAYRRQIVSYQDGAPVRIGDVATVTDGRRMPGSPAG